MIKISNKKNKINSKKTFSLTRDELLNKDLYLLYEVRQFLFYQFELHKNIPSIRGRRKNRHKNKNILRTSKLIDKVLWVKALEAESASSRADSPFLNDSTYNLVDSFPLKKRNLNCDILEVLNAGKTITCMDLSNSIEPDFNTFTLYKEMFLK